MGVAPQTWSDQLSIIDQYINTNGAGSFLSTVRIRPSPSSMGRMTLVFSSSRDSAVRIETAALKKSGPGEPTAGVC